MLAVVAVVAVGAVAVVALSGGDDDATTGPPSGVTLDDLEPALLTEDDVGRGFRLDESDDDEDEDPMDLEDLDSSDECREAMEAMEESDQASDEIGVDFVGEADATVQQTIALLGPSSASLSDVRAAMDECGTVAFDEDGAHGEFRFETHDLDGLGDDAIEVDIVVAMEVQGGLSFTIESYGVMWERDGVASSVNGFGGFDEMSLEALPVDEAWVRELATTVDGRVADALAG